MSTVNIENCAQFLSALKPAGLKGPVKTGCIGTIAIPTEAWRLANSLAEARTDLATLPGATGKSTRRGTRKNEVNLDARGLVGEIAVQLLLRKSKRLTPGPLIEIRPPAPGADFKIDDLGFDTKTLKQTTREAQINKKGHDAAHARHSVDYYMILHLDCDSERADVYVVTYEEMDEWEVRYAFTPYYRCPLSSISRPEMMAEAA